MLENFDILVQIAEKFRPHVLGDLELTAPVPSSVSNLTSSLPDKETLWKAYVCSGETSLIALPSILALNASHLPIIFNLFR